MPVFLRALCPLRNPSVKHLLEIFMKGLNIHSKQRGFTLIEVGIALAIGLVIVMGVARSIQLNQEKVQMSQAVNDVNTILVSAVEWRGSANNYQGIAMSQLALPTHLKTAAVAAPAAGGTPTAATYGIAVNPWGGDYQINSGGNNNDSVLITVTGLTGDIPVTLARRFNGNANATSTTASTAVITFK